MNEKSPRPTRRAFSSASLITSVVIHGGLALGVVVVGLRGLGEAPPPRVYTLAVAPPSDPLVVPPEAEELAAFEAEEAPLDGEPELREAPELPDLDAFDESGRRPVLAGQLPNSSEFVYGARAAEAPPVEPAIEPLPAPPELEEPPEDAPSEERAGAPEDVEYTRLAGDEPKYPRASKRLGEEGDVVLGLRVDDAGFVVSVELRSSSGYRRLDQSAMGAALTWRFPSGTPTEIKHTVHFVLQQ